MSNSLRLTEDEARVIIARINKVAHTGDRTGLQTRIKGTKLVGPGVEALAVLKKQPRRRSWHGKWSKLEIMFAEQIQLLQLPPAAREWVFLSSRKFRLDFAWPQFKLAVEIQGMQHRIKGRFKADIEKRALALLNGWRVLEVGGTEIRSGKAAAWIVTLIEMELATPREKYAYGWPVGDPRKS